MAYRGITIKRTIILRRKFAVFDFGFFLATEERSIGSKCGLMANSIAKRSGRRARVRCFSSEFTFQEAHSCKYNNHIHATSKNYV